ncbi:hypothetical protein GGF46_004431 [Coemansia sp. RSA 552]|nr:hypothetical protein GGF46_004431 [Coemansia sp. RSA 552]
MSLGQAKPIVGGTSAGTHAYPFAVYLSIETQPSWHAVCGGTLVSRKHVVTAGHCVHHAPSPEAVKLGVGHAHVKHQQRRVARKISVHPQFDKRTLANDIAIIELDKDVQENEHAHRIPVYFGDVPAGATVTTMGWGITSNLPGARTVSAMNKVDLMVAEPGLCRNVDGAFIDNNGPFVCTSTQPGNHDECNGDSGSPAVITLNNGRIHRYRHGNRRTRTAELGDMHLVALTSYGDNQSHDEHPPCGDPAGFGFSTHVAYYHEFIQNATGLSRQQLEEPVRLDRLATADHVSAAFQPQVVWLNSVIALVAVLVLMCK